MEYENCLKSVFEDRFISLEWISNQDKNRDPPQQWLSFRVLRAEFSACVPTCEEAPADTVDSSVIYINKIIVSIIVRVPSLREPRCSRVPRFVILLYTSASPIDLAVRDSRATRDVKQRKRERSRTKETEHGRARWLTGVHIIIPHPGAGERREFFL